MRQVYRQRLHDACGFESHLWEYIKEMIETTIQLEHKRLSDYLEKQ